MGARRILEGSPNIAAIAEWGQYNMPYYFGVSEGVSCLANLGFSFWGDGRLALLQAKQMIGRNVRRPDCASGIAIQRSETKNGDLG